MRRCSRHMFLLFCLIAFLIPSFIAFSQSFTLFHPDARAYPLMRAGFYFFDADGNRVLDLMAGEFVLTENGELRRIVSVQCPPPQEPKAISAVLTIDVSGSMSGEGMALAREAAGAWIDAFPAGLSECAITSFTTQNALHQDFTNDRTLLRAAVAGLNSGGGTSFDAALLFPFAGALPVAARGRHRKVIVLLTDGHATGSERAIIDEARRIDARIFCITLDNIMPDVLRRIAEETGGQCFENVTSIEDARRVYRSILELAQEIPPCIITWESEGCAYYRDVRCELPGRGAVARNAYSVTDAELPRLVIEPGRVIEFGPVAPGNSAESVVKLRAEGHAVTIAGITPELPLFTITEYGGAPPPFVLQAGEQRVLKLRYTAEDSAYVICRVLFETNACDAGFFATAGAPGSGRDRRVIRLLHPNGGEVFVAGSDTLITWEGVAPTDPVRLEYSTDNGATWRRIAENVTGLSYAWRVPATPSEYCLARVTAPLRGTQPDDMVIIPAGSFIMGDLIGNGSPDEHPTSRITITRPFLMSRTEITLRQWRAVDMRSGSVTGPDDTPIRGFEAREAMRYCNARSLAEDLDSCYRFAGADVYCDFDANGYRLPTEAEWEYACRAGNNDDFHSGRMTEPYCLPLDPNLDATAWYCGNAALGPVGVGQKMENSFGLYDMHGNVREICWGDYDAAYTGDSKLDPRGPNPLTTAHRIVVRGGGYSDLASACRSAVRHWTMLPGSGSMTGFRVVRNL